MRCEYLMDLTTHNQLKSSLTMLSFTSKELLIPAFLVAGITVLYFWLTNRQFSYWSNKGVKTPRTVPFIGNLWPLLTRQIAVTDYMSQLYFKYKKDRFVGVYVTKIPFLVVTDNELMFRMMSQDMPSFESHGLKMDLEKDPLSGNLFNTSGTHWKNLRAKLTPTFTTGKLKVMYTIMEHTGTLLQDLVAEPARTGESVNVLDVLGRFSTDVIGSTAFGLEINSIDDEHSQFRKMGKKVFEPISFKGMVLSSLSAIVPFVRHFLPAHDKADVRDFFVKVITDMVEYREKNNITRNDFLDLLLKLKNNKLTDDQGNLIDLSESDTDKSFTINHKELMSQVYVFFLAGFETSSATAGLALYAMALNQDVQDRARQDVLDSLQKHGGRYTYEALGDMQYLGNVINETLRQYSTVNILFRQCTSTYTIPDTNVKVDKGTMVFFPIGGVHNDPELWENPEKFDPDRFLPERKPDNLSHIYMPFGQGPRICIGQRFGLLQTKLALAKLLAKYKFEPSARTKVPMEYSKPGSTPNLSPADGIHLTVKPI